MPMPMRKKILFSTAAVLAVILAVKLLYPWTARKVAAIPRDTPADLAKVAGWAGRDPNAADAFRFIVVGDRTGRLEPGAWARAVTDVNRLRPDFVLSVGDLVDGAMDRDDVREEWAEFEAIHSKLDAPMLAAPGNHDVGTPEARAAYVARYGVGGKGYYAANYRRCRFIVLDTTALLHELDEAQWDWLAGELASAGDAKHVFLVGHHPLFEIPKAWKRLRPMLDGLPLTAFFGHDHLLSYGVEDGVPCYVLGPTGARGVGPRSGGRFQSFLHVVVDDGEPTVAIIPMGEVLPHDFVRRRTPTTAPTSAPAPPE